MSDPALKALLIALWKEGMVVVPFEPTLKMVRAGYEKLDYKDAPTPVWQAMIDAYGKP